VCRMRNDMEMLLLCFLSITREASFPFSCWRIERCRKSRSSFWRRLGRCGGCLSAGGGRSAGDPGGIFSESGGGTHLPDTLMIDGAGLADPNVPALRQHPNVRIITNAQVQKTKAENGSYRFSIRQQTPAWIGKSATTVKPVSKCAPSTSMTISTKGSASGRPSTSFNPRRASTTFQRRYAGLSGHLSSQPGHSVLCRFGGRRQYAESLAKIRERLPFALSIGRVCPHPCETACNRGQVDEPISICTLKRFVADWEMQHEVRLPWRFLTSFTGRRWPSSGQDLPA